MITKTNAELNSDRRESELNDLLFCPFCGNDNQDDKTIQVYEHKDIVPILYEAHVECDQCDCVGPFTYMATSREEAKQYAIKHWNHRAK